MASVCDEEVQYYTLRDFSEKIAKGIVGIRKVARSVSVVGRIRNAKETQTTPQGDIRFRDFALGHILYEDNWVPEGGM